MKQTPPLLQSKVRIVFNDSIEIFAIKLTTSSLERAVRVPCASPWAGDDKQAANMHLIELTGQY